MILTIILVLILVIFVVSILGALSNFVKAGGNISKLLSKKQKPDTSILSKNTDNNNFTTQGYRTVAGILFGILLLYPLVIFGDKPIIDISSNYRLILFALIIFLELTLFITIWLKDRK